MGLGPADVEGEGWLFRIWLERLQVELVFDVERVGQMASSMSDTRKRLYLRKRRLSFVKACRSAGFRLREIGQQLRPYNAAVLAETERREALLTDKPADRRVQRGDTSGRAREGFVPPSRDGALVDHTIDVGQRQSPNRARSYWKRRTTDLRKRLAEEGWDETLVDAELKAFEAVVRATAMRRKLLPLQEADR